MTLAGLRFCITGDLALEREEMSALLEEAGARVTSCVSGKTDYLIVGLEPGLTKLNKAMEWRTPMIDEGEAFRMIGITPPLPAASLLLDGYRAPESVHIPGLPAIEQATYAVVDVETSGGWGAARVIEIAIVQVDARGEVLDEYATLIDPEGPVGLTRIHGITSAAVQGAPLFAEIAGDVLARLAGHVFVAHNAGFDRGFVVREFARLEQELPAIASLCTMRLARRLRLHPGSATLDQCCNFMGIPLERHHAALADARASAKLLVKYLDAARERGVESLSELGLRHPPAPRAEWPTLPQSRRVHLRRGLELRLSASAPSIPESLPAS